MKARRLDWLSKDSREAGQTMVEYALLAALIAVIVMVAVSEVGEALVGVFERIRDEIANV